MQQDTTSRSLLKNSSYSFLGYTLPIIFSIAITPVIVRKLGVTDYGIYILAITINGFLGLVDLGIGLSIIKYASEYRAKGDLFKLNKLLGSVNLLFLSFGIFGWLVYFAIGKYFLHIFNITKQQQENILPVFLLAGLVFLISSLAIVATSVLKAWQRYDLTVKISLGFLTAFNLAFLVIVLLGYKLKVVYLTNVIFTFVAWMFYLKFAGKATGLKIFHFDWSFEEVRRCYRFGLAAFVTNISNNTLTQIDRLIIPGFLSPAQLSYYSLPGNVAEKINGVTGSSTGVLFPMLSSLTASEDITRIKSIYIKVFRNIPVLAAAMAICAGLFADKILLYWVGKDFADSGALILVILAATNAILAVYSVLQNFLLGFGKVRFLMKASMFMAAVNVCSLLWLIPKYGIKGAALAYLISVLPVGFYFYWVEKRFLSLSFRLNFYIKLFFKLLITGLIFYLLYKFVLNPLVVNLLSMILVGGASVPLFLILYKLLGFVEEEDLETYKGFLKTIKLRLTGKTI